MAVDGNKAPPPIPEPVRQCIFCGNPDHDKLTCEHLWPRWSHKTILRSMRKWESVRGMHQIETGGVGISDVRTRRHGGDIHDMQVKCVCGGDKTSCNNGWMREIENHARPILIPLMNGNRIRLSPDQQKIIAGWAALKAMVAEYEPTSRVTTPQTDRNHMMATGEAPEPGWGIWIGHYERVSWPGHLGAVPFVFWPEDERAHLLGVPTTDFNGQSSFQVVKKLFIQIVRCRMPELVEKWRFDARASAVLRKIWPNSGYSFNWPPPTMSDRDADYVANALPRAIITAVQRKLAREARPST